MKKKPVERTKREAIDIARVRECALCAMSAEAVAKEFGVHHLTLNRACLERTGKTYQQLLTEAAQRHRSHILEGLEKLTKGHFVKIVDKNGDCVERYFPPDWRAVEWGLSRIFPQKESQDILVEIVEVKKPLPQIGDRDGENMNG